MNRELSKEKRKVKPADAVRILKEKGREITEKEAEEILDFLYFIGKLTVNQYIKDNSINKGK